MSIFSFFKRKPKEPKCPIGIDPVLFKAIWVNRSCPDCGNDTFRMGPQGGLCQNVMCANVDCESRFNLAPFDDNWCGFPFMIDRISDPSPSKKKPEAQ
jgi:hypothetical protein